MRNTPETPTIQNARDFIAEMAGGLSAHASVIRTYAEWGNDAGLVYAARSSAAYLKAMQAGIEELDRCRAFAMYQRNASKIGSGAGLSDGDA